MLEQKSVEYLNRFEWEKKKTSHVNKNKTNHKFCAVSHRPGR